MNLKPHPVSLIIPEASPEDFAGLVEPIRAAGQLEPIRTWQGRVIDGRHRLKACEQFGIEPVLREVRPEEVDGGTARLFAGAQHQPASCHHVATGAGGGQGRDRDTRRRSDQSLN